MGSRWANLGGALALTVAACTSSGADRSSGAGGAEQADPVDLVGETDQGLRVRLDVVASREVRLRFPAVCTRDDAPGDDVVVSLHRHPLLAPVDRSGAFAVDETYVDDGTDGDEEHVEVRIEGAFGADGTAAGTFEVTSRWWNGQSREFGPTCATGTVRWVADGPPVEGDDLVVPVDDPSAPAAAGPDLVARLGAGELVRVAAATGEVRYLSRPVPPDPAPAPSGSDASTAPVVSAGPGDSAVAPSWMTNLGVVGDGVWAVDSASGALSRFDLAGGGPTATIEVPLDSMAVGQDALWTVSTNVFRSGFALDRRDPVTGAVVATAPVQPGRIIVGPSELWYADGTLAGGRLWRVDAATATTTSPLDVDIPLHGELVASADRVWWLDPGGEGLVAFDPHTAQVTRIDLPSAPEGLAADAGGVWTVHAQEAVARRVEGGQVVRTVDVPDGYWHATVAADSAVWLVGTGVELSGSRAIRLDPAVTAG